VAVLQFPSFAGVRVAGVQDNPLADGSSPQLPARPIAEKHSGAQPWASDDHFVYYAPAASQASLSHNISDYYYALGARSALSEEMARRRVGGHGRVHIFHMPQGPLMPQAREVATRRHAGLSELVRMELGVNLAAALPEYRRPPEYRLPRGYLDPLALQRDQELLVIEGITEPIYARYLDEMTNPNSEGLKVKSRNWLNAEDTAKVVAFLKGEFERMGFTTCVQEFKSWNHPDNRRAAGRKVSNVIAYVEGTDVGTVTMGAHFDSMPPKDRGSSWLFNGNPDNLAPGAVDNGSGVAAVLTMAKAWMEAYNKAGLRPKKSMYFVAFGGEEENLYGSDRFAQELRTPGSSNSRIPANCRPYPTDDHKAIIMDMIGWRNPRFQTDTVTMETKTWAADMFASLAQSNVLNNGNRLKLLYGLDPYGSDHESFLNRAMEAVLTIDNDGDENAYRCYHRTCDTIIQVSTRLATEISRMNMGAMLREALLN